MRRSLAENDLTVVSIFVNPAQFAPHEDLATYPRTLPHDLEVLSALKVHTTSGTHSPSAVFVPSVYDMYPSGISQNVAEQKGTFVEVKGYSHQMEGKTRPTFFRGVATVVTKLFNVIEVCAPMSIRSQGPNGPASLRGPTSGRKTSSRPSCYDAWSATSCFRTPRQKTCTSCLPPG